MLRCVAMFRARDWIEPVEQQQAGEEPADMRLPRDWLIIADDLQLTRAKNQINAHPYDQKDNNARIAQHAGQWNRRHAISFIVVAAPKTERTAALKCKSYCACHSARDGSRSSDNCAILACMHKQIRERAGGGGNCEKSKKAQCSETPRHCTSKWQKPNSVDPEMHPTAMNEGISDKSPNLGGQPAWQRSSKNQ